MRLPLSILSLIFAAITPSFSETQITGLAWPALSPDGKTLAFEWLNDIWIAPSSGGEATRLVKHPSREAYPKFTPDGKHLAFSSERTGTPQLYTIKLDGSDPKQHTSHTGGHILEAISPDGTYAITKGYRYQDGYKPFRLSKIDLTQDSRELLLFDVTAHSPSISPDGNQILFCTKGEQLYREGYIGSRASQIHLFDSSGQTFTPIFTEKHENRSPIWLPDGKSFYYVSSKSGLSNIWLHSLSKNTDTQLTFHEDSGVILPTLSANGEVMVFRSGLDVFHFQPTKNDPPKAIHFFTNESLPDRSTRKFRVSGTSSVTFDSDTSRIIFSSAGDLWTLAKGEEEPTRLTSTDEQDEDEPILSPDGKTLFYLQDNGIESHVIKAGWTGKETGTVTKLKTSSRSKRRLELSPDGSTLAWIEATGDLHTASTTEGEARLVMPNWDVPTCDWSPDGKWLVIAAKDIHANRDIFIAPADGSHPAYNLTNHPAFEGSPKWSPDGKTIVFTARREADELARLWTIDLKGKLDSPEQNLSAIQASIRAVDTDISEPTRVTWSPDSSLILFQSRDTSDKTVYSIPPAGDEVSEYLPFRGIPAERTKEGETLWRIDRTPTIEEGKKLTEFPFSFSVRQDRPSRSRLGFRRIWRTLSERFYDETMNGKDWEKVRLQYEDAAAASLDSRQFDRVVAQLLGELNASHLTFKTKPWGGLSKDKKQKDKTAHTGLIFENTWSGKLRITGVIPGSPISKLPDPPAPGDTVLRIAGQDMDARTPLVEILNGAKGRALPLVISTPGGKTKTMELVPISYGKAQDLDRERKTQQARTLAETDTPPIAYLPFHSMKSGDLFTLTTEVYRASLTAKGLILDLRDNAGGRVADELLALFCQPAHSFTIPRGGQRGYPSDRRIDPSWDGPMVVLCNENTYSNAEIFCHAFKRTKRGTLIGVPTNGGVISAIGVSIPEVGELQVPFRGWFHQTTGKDLELNGAIPDIIVPTLPTDQSEGKDPQLEKAIEVLHSQLKKTTPDVPAIMKTGREILPKE